MKNNSVLNEGVRIVNQFLPILFWVTLILGFEEKSTAILTILAALVHESGHILFLKHRGISKSGLRGDLSGFRIRSYSMMSYKEEMMLYLSGPIANIVAAFALAFLRSEVAEAFCILNIATALSNLMPIEGYDGYGALRVLAEYASTTGTAVRALEVISSGLVFAFCILSVYFIDRFGSGYWIFGIFFLSMLRELQKLLKNAKHEK